MSNLSRRGLSQPRGLFIPLRTSYTRERDATKTGVPDLLNETAGDIDGRGPHGQFEDLRGSDALFPEDMMFDVENVAIVEISNARLLTIEGDPDAAARFLSVFRSPIEPAAAAKK